MLFVGIQTWEPSATEVLTKRMTEKGFPVPEGVELIGLYHDLGGGRSFALLETDDPQALATSSMRWADLLKMEIVPVIQFLEMQ